MSICFPFDLTAVSEKQVIKKISVVFSFFFSMGGAQINVLKSQKNLKFHTKDNEENGMGCSPMFPLYQYQEMEGMRFCGNLQCA